MKKIPTDAFDFYFSLGPSRSYQSVADRYHVSKRAVTSLAKREDWQRRLLEIEAKARQSSDKEKERVLEAAYERHMKALRLVFGKGHRSAQPHGDRLPRRRDAGDSHGHPGGACGPGRADGTYRGQHRGHDSRRVRKVDGGRGGWRQFRAGSHGDRVGNWPGWTIDPVPRPERSMNTEYQKQVG
jgi:hypothetical protein